MPETLSYRGPAGLTLRYRGAPVLSRTGVRLGIAVVVSRHAAGAPVSVLAIAESGDCFEIAAGAPANQEERYA